MLHPCSAGLSPFGRAPGIAALSPEAVAWEAVVGCTASGNSLTKTAGTGWGNAGAISTKGILSGDGYVEATIYETNTYQAFGLAKGNSGTNFDDIDFAMHLYLNGLTIYENASVIGSFGTYVIGDKMRISVDAGVVTYKKNGVTLYTSAKSPAYPLLVDTAPYSQGCTLSGVMLFGALGDNGV